jgi:hypothetical protein
LVPNTTWHHHRLGAGVVESGGVATDARGSVNMHVLRVDLSNKRVSLKPLLRSVAERLPLTTLASRHRRLVAATNTGYFDFGTGAPIDPLIVAGTPYVISNLHQTVVGIGRNGVAEAGQVWTSGSVTAAGSSRPLVATNDTNAPSGVSLFDRHWGAAQVPVGWSTTTRAVVNGVITAGSLDRHATVPKGGYLLQARGRLAGNWLSRLGAGSKVSISSTVKTTAVSPFVQAYGVGAQLVSQPGVAKTGFSCNSANTTQPARTAIGWAHGGRSLVIAVVADHPHTSTHGLDEDQMSKLMTQLGVGQAYAFDGSGSSELLAKRRGTSSLALQNYPADGQERPMPVGLGVSVAPAPKRHHRHH